MFYTSFKLTSNVVFSKFIICKKMLYNNWELCISAHLHLITFRLFNLLFPESSSNHVIYIYKL